MITLSFRGKDSSTAFLIHWCTVHWPTPSRVATRSLPVFRSAITCSTASLTSLGAEEAEMVARFSHAVSMICWSCWVMGIFLTLALDELHDALGGFQAFRGVGHQGHAHPPGAGVHASRFTREVAAGQHGHIVLSQQVAGEIGVASTHAGPEVEAGVGEFHVQDLRQQRLDF